MPRLDELRAAARYLRDKHALYRAKTYGPRPTSPARLKALERAATDAQERLDRAERAQAGRD